ncbi:MAG TPA: hypothetical protein VN961_19430, partial [Streptosporangiaceae bacterium]|nr:hypothetical protein [Streptosporangiaceae bacterium]
MGNRRSPFARTMAAALVAGVAATAGLAWRVQQDGAHAAAAQQQAITGMQAEINRLRSNASQQADWSQLAAQVEPSVF